MYKTCSKCNTEKSHTDYHKRKDTKDGLMYICKACNKNKSRKVWNDKKEELKKWHKDYYKNNRDKILTKKVNYYILNKDTITTRQKQYRENNIIDIRARESAKNRRRKLATPKWADKQKIEHIYWICKLITDITGIKHHVDHIIPLQGKNISGLHVPENLQILTAEENLRKGNRYD